MTDRTSPTFRRIHLLQRVRGELSGSSCKRVFPRADMVSRAKNPKLPLRAVCEGHRRVAKNRKLGFRGHVRSTWVAVDWERSCFALVRVVSTDSSFDKRSLLCLTLIIGKICFPVLLYSFERR